MIRSDYVDANGLRIHLLRGGAGMPLVLLHGWPEFSRVFRKNLPVLGQRFEVVAPDLRGFGATRPFVIPDVQVTPELLARDLEALVDRLGFERFGLVSHDVGAFAAQAFVRMRPERLTGLFFFNCPYPGIGRRWAEADHLAEIWYQSFHQLDWAPRLVGHSRETCRLYIGHFLRHWAHDPHAFDEDLEAWVDQFLEPGALEGGFAWYKGVNEQRLRIIRNGPPALAPITVPTRVLWGESDPVLKPAWSDRLADYFTDVRLSIAREAGHFVHYERPELANAEIQAFFASA